MEAALLSLLALLVLLLSATPTTLSEPKRIVIIEPEASTPPSTGPMIGIMLIVLFVLVVLLAR
jgi:hypothetical protein